MARRPKTPAPPTPTFGLGILRTVRGSVKRFAALATICALGAIMLVGLKIACVDLRYSADEFFDVQQLFDIRVQSTLGLTSDDVDALADLQGVEAAEGGYVETAYTSVGSGSEKVDVKALSASGEMNEPLVLEGALPGKAGEVAVTRRFIDDSGFQIGDTVSFRTEGDEGEDAAAASSDADADDDADDLLATDESTEVFDRGDYTIVGVVLDPTDINAGEGSMSFRSSGSSPYSFFVTEDAVADDVQGTFTVVYLRVADAADPLCYSDDYEALVDDVKQRVEGVREEREAARGEGLRADANETIDEAEADAQDELDDAADQIADAQKELDDGAEALEDAQQTLDAQETSAEAQLDAAQRKIAAGYAQIEAAEQALDLNESQLNAGEKELAEGLGVSTDQIGPTLAASREELEANRAQLTAGADEAAATMGDAWPADAWSRLAAATTAADAEAPAAEVTAAVSAFTEQAQAQIDAGKQQLEQAQAQIDAAREQLAPMQEAAAAGQLTEEQKAQLEAQLAALDEQEAQLAEQQATLEAQEAALPSLAELAPGMAQLVAADAQLTTAEKSFEQLHAGRIQIAEGRQQIADSRAELASGAAELSASRAEALAQIADGQAQIDAAAAELADGQAELDDAREEYADAASEAAEKIADARDQVADIEDATWYVQDRSSLGSYASVESDASSIETIGTVIPIVFFVVAVLISLTTMTRMVEEERGVIGLYKALGYSRSRILSKYVIYAAAACLAGGVAGDFLGLVVLSLILFTIFSTMYALPSFSLCFDAAYAFGAIALFAVGIVGATVLTCRHELAETPASLMRPKAPRAGSRILLERITPLWRRLGFLNKVTARNIFRYKKRFFMTVFGIAGCTALLVTGFGIRDTVISLSARQYGDSGVTRYDLLAATSADDLEDVASELEKNATVEDLVRVYFDSVTVEYAGAKESVQLVVVPEGTSLTGYIDLRDENGTTYDLGRDAEVVITKNVEQVLGFATGDELTLQDTTLATGTAAADAVVLNYLGNTLIMTEGAYCEAFGVDADCSPNAMLAHLSGDSDHQIAFGEKLGQDSRYLSIVCTAKLQNDFSSAFTLINTVVYIVIVLAAALSFTVVFTLSNTNISERERELATIKVLGFKRGEVHRYINKETLLLTGVGAVVGLPVGYAIARSLTWILKMPSLYFDVIVEPATYAISVVLAFAFTLIVNRLTNRTLDRIDMVGALKSAE